MWVSFVIPQGWLEHPHAVNGKPLFFPKQFYCWGSQCFLSMFDLSGMLCPPGWACLRSCLPSLVFGLVSELVWDAVSAWACLPSCLRAGLGCCVRQSGNDINSKFHVRFLYRFGVYGGVIDSNCCCYDDHYSCW